MEGSSEEQAQDDADLEDLLQLQKNSVNNEGLEEEKRDVADAQEPVPAQEDKNDSTDHQEPGLPQLSQIDLGSSLISAEHQSLRRSTSKGPSTFLSQPPQ